MQSITNFSRPITSGDPNFNTIEQFKNVPRLGSSQKGSPLKFSPIKAHRPTIELDPRNLNLPLIDKGSLKPSSPQLSQGSNGQSIDVSTFASQRKSCFDPMA
jgi:hypothetical protein